jgi:hypothetical protein
VFLLVLTVIVFIGVIVDLATIATAKQQANT